MTLTTVTYGSYNSNAHPSRQVRRLKFHPLRQPEFLQRQSVSLNADDGFRRLTIVHFSHFDDNFCIFRSPDSDQYDNSVERARLSQSSWQPPAGTSHIGLTI